MAIVNDPNTEYVLSLSYGKDSIACLEACKILGWRIDRVVHAEVWATQDIPADLPPMVEFKKHADAVIHQKYGLSVEHTCASSCDGLVMDKVSYSDMFYKPMTKGKHINSIKGFPMIKGHWCTKLKTSAVKSFTGNSTQYLGIASDEPTRISRHSKRSDVLLPLVELGWNEAFCKHWCEENDLLSPIYTTATRGGCWFCHNQGIDQLRLLRRNYPDLWQILLGWDTDSPVSFKADGHTVHDYDRRFAAEDEGIILPNDPKFRWCDIDGDTQLKLFL